MPEGDTIHRIARALASELPGRMMDRLELRDRGEVRELAGRRIDRVEARGKHLLVHIEGGWTLRTHLGMHGRWTRRHVREPGPARPTVVLLSDDVLYACERAYTAELVRTSSLRSHARLSRLGPDLLSEPPPVEAAAARAALPAYRDREIGDLLLDQRVASGIGNVYKSEVLFECKIDPRTPAGELSAERLTAVYASVARLMRMNLGTRRRTTVPLARRPRPSSPRLWVYGRKGAPCLDCETAIQRFVQGDAGRTTYFCPRCQSRG